MSANAENGVPPSDAQKWSLRQIFMRPTVNITLSIALPFLWMAILRTALVQGGENSYDAYYHVAMADGGLGRFLSKELPAMGMSVWEHHFSDKELLYHAALFAVRKVHGLVGGGLEPPFHSEALLFSLLMIASFVAALRICRVKETVLPALALALACPFFTNRMLMLRPHVLSVAFMMLSIPAFARAASRRGMALLFLLGFLYAWSYSNPHFILLPGACFFAARIGEGFFKAAAPPLSALAGVVAGLIAHPQFPNTLLNWKVQCIDVPLLSLMPSSAPVNPPLEMLPPSPTFFLFCGLMAGGFIFNLSLYAALKASGREKSLSITSLALFASSSLAFSGAFFSPRAIEYACPLTIFASVMMLKEISLMSCLPKGFKFSPMAKPLFAAAILTVGIASISPVKAQSHRWLVKPLNDFTSWMDASGIPKDEVIANITWADFTCLYYAMPDRRYLCGLDPMFAYVRHPERFARIESFRLLNTWLSTAELSEATKAKYAFVHRRNRTLGRYMKLGGYKAIYEGKDGCLFSLTP